MAATERDPPENEMAQSLAEDDYKTANVGEVVPLTILRRLRLPVAFAHAAGPRRSRHMHLAVRNRRQALQLGNDDGRIGGGVVDVERRAGTECDRAAINIPFDLMPMFIPLFYSEDSDRLPYLRIIIVPRW